MIIQVDYKTSSPEELQRLVASCKTPCKLLIANCTKEEMAGIARLLDRTTGKLVSNEGTHIFIL